jgi:lysozyme family protein
MPTLQQTNPENAQKAKDIIDKWLAGGYPYRINDVHWSMNVFDQALKSSRNDMPAVRGFQQTLNLFGLKDAKGRPFAVDGIVGQNTSAALRQNGFKSIFDFINVVKGVQKALGLKVDGIVGKNTLAAFQQAGITSFDALRKYLAFITRKQNQSAIASVNAKSAPAINQPQVTAPTQPATLARPKAAAPGNAQA